MIWIGAAVAVVLALVANAAYVGWYFRWEDRETRGMAYYGRPLAARRALKRRMRLLSLPALPVVRLLARLRQRHLVMPSFEFEGVSGPPKISSPQVFENARRYLPRPEDVFVVTQMRCGTTWMQQLVYETVCAGDGDLSDRGHGHLYAISPWIDAVNSVPMEAAPIVGRRPTRIVKSHLPVSLCPYSTDARYIYVTRHPVSCFASILDYNRSLLGPLAPPVDTLVEWYCSERMYWRSWPRHVEGWWRWAETRRNVLFVHFEEMTGDFAGVQCRVEKFLGCDVTPAERARIREKCSFRYMRDHEDVFEMAPPTMFSVTGGRFLASGAATRHDDVTPAVRRRILDFCRQELIDGSYPAARFYPDLWAPQDQEVASRAN